MRRKSYLIPSYVASFFSFNLSYILKKTIFGLMNMSYLYTKEDGLLRVYNLKRQSKMIPGGLVVKIGELMASFTWV